METTLNKTAAALERRGYETIVCATGAEAADAIRREMEKAQSVGFGGSETIKALGIPELAKRMGKTILRHGDPSLSPEEKMAVMRGELTCDLFLLSANAMTADGVIVNIDGNGNRVAASIFGPKRVVFAVGRNKIVDGGVEAAMERVKHCACPPNCRRLSKRTPCAATGVCADCSSPDRICKVTTIFDRRPTKTSILVILIDEDLGY